MNDDQKQYLADLKAVVDEGKSVNDSLAEVLPKLKGVEQLGEFRDALKQLETQMAEQLKTPGGQVRRIEQLSYDRGRYRGVFAHEGEALCFGLYLRAFVEDQQDSKSVEAFSAEYRNLYGRDYSTDPGSAGGDLQGSDFLDRILSYFEEFGGIYAAATKVPVSGAEASLLKENERGTGDTAGVYLVNEGQAPNVSNDKFSKVNFIPREWARLVYYPERLARTARGNIRVGEMVARSIAYSFRKAYDFVTLQGTGSVDHLRVMGVVPKLQGLDADPANVAGLSVGSGNAWDALTDADHTQVMGSLSDVYADGGDTGWWCSRNYFFEVMVRLMLSAGGVTAGEVEGRRRLLFHGEPVNITTVMPKVEAASQVAALFGSVREAVAIGESLTLTLRTSDQAKWAERQIGVMGLVESDVVAHNLGNASDDANKREAGALIGLQTAAA
ncbi:MAG: phage major capsid protein [Planctomycetota bacterium]